jgi:hypothetical protein
VDFAIGRASFAVAETGSEGLKAVSDFMATTRKHPSDHLNQETYTFRLIFGGRINNLQPRTPKPRIPAEALPRCRPSSPSRHPKVISGKKGSWVIRGVSLFTACGAPYRFSCRGFATEEGGEFCVDLFALGDQLFCTRNLMVMAHSAATSFRSERNDSTDGR